MSADFEIGPVGSPADLAIAASLFRAYADSLGVDLAYQDFATELATLPGKYAPPNGVILLARDAAGAPLGCIALRPMATDGHCEMKRLYVVPAGRGLGLGKKLVAAVISEAERIGYRAIYLDTLPTMTEATDLYFKAGFQPTDAYYATPVAGTKFLRRMLGR